MITVALEVGDYVTWSRFQGRMFKIVDIPTDPYTIGTWPAREKSYVWLEDPLGASHAADRSEIEPVDFE